MDYDFFKMSMDSYKVFLEARNITYNMTTKILKSDYYEKFKKYPNKRFSEAIEWIKENYDMNRYPTPGNFIEGLSKTTPNQNYSYTHKKIDKEEFSREMLALAEKFRIPGAKGDGKTKKIYRITELYKRKLADGQVFSYKKMKWVDRTLMKNIGGNFLLPEEKL